MAVWWEIELQGVQKLSKRNGTVRFGILLQSDREWSYVLHGVEQRERKQKKRVAETSAPLNSIFTRRLERTMWLRE